MVQVRVIGGDIALAVKVDAIVAPTDPTGQYGGIDQAIFRVANNHYHNELADAIIREGGWLDHGRLVFADGPTTHKHRGSFQNVIFVVDNRDTCLDYLVFVVLLGARSVGYTTLALPVMRAGSAMGRVHGCEESLEEIIQHMLVGIRDFGLEFPDSRLQVTIVTHNNPKAFELIRRSIQ